MTVLAIEAAIGGGSVAILSEDTVLGKWHGRELTARSEQILKVISELLEETSVEKRSITRLAVSNGPGSYTGIRIGLATAMGLSRALDVPVAGVSALQAIADSRTETRKIVVVPLGRGGYCWKVFSGPNEDTTPEMFGTGNQEAVLDQILLLPEHAVIAHADAFASIVSDPRATSRLASIQDFGYDVAVAVGDATASIDDGLSPFYARETGVSPVSPS